VVDEIGGWLVGGCSSQIRRGFQIRVPRCGVRDGGCAGSWVPDSRDAVGEISPDEQMLQEVVEQELAMTTTALVCFGLLWFALVCFGLLTVVAALAGKSS
jgi:hypothetical protein